MKKEQEVKELTFQEKLENQIKGLEMKVKQVEQEYFKILGAKELAEATLKEYLKSIKSEENETI